MKIIDTDNTKLLMTIASHIEDYNKGKVMANTYENIKLIRINPRDFKLVLLKGQKRFYNAK